MIAQLTTANPAWRTLVGMGESLLANLPNIVLGSVLFAIFSVAARFSRGLIRSAGERTALEPSLSILLGRLTSTAVSVLGPSLAAIVVFPAFEPGDWIVTE